MKIFKKIRFYSRMLAAFIRKHRRLLFIGMSFGFLIFYFFPKLNQWVGPKEQIKIGLVGRYTPGELPQEVLSLISRGLTRVEPDGTALPDLAEKWETKNEGREYFFTLKDGLYWQDGSALKAADINYFFADVTTVASDDKTLIFKLKEPYSPFPLILSRPIFKNGLLGIGEYEVKDLKTQGQIVQSLTLKPRNSSLPKLNYRFYPSETAARTGFKLGEIDKLEKIASLGNLEEWPNLKITSKSDPYYYVGLFFNTQDPFLQEKSLRQALAYALKKPWENRALNPISPNSWAYQSEVKPYPYDPENARKLFDQSLEEREDKMTTISLGTTPSLLALGEKISKDWESLGLKTNLRVINALPENFQVLLLIQEIPQDPDQYTLWHSTQPTNITRYQNPKIDNLLEEGRKTLDQKKRKEIYADFQKAIVEESPAVFLYHPPFYNVERE